jgi:hypothetical protein
MLIVAAAAFAKVGAERRRIAAIPPAASRF